MPFSELAGLLPPRGPRSLARLATLRARAVAARVVPLTQVEVSLGNGTAAPLAVYEGDQLGAAVERFRLSHGLAEGGQQRLRIVELA